MITQERLKELFSYDTIKGGFIRKVKLTYQHEIGDNVGSLSSNGYKTVKVDGTQYQLHRLIWLYFYGTLPDFIDHIDGDKCNNLLENLRECTREQNRFNTTAYKSNKIGIKGVMWIEPKQAYRAQVKAHKKRYFIDYRVTKERTKEQALQAAIAWVETQRELLHGNFCCND